MNELQEKLLRTLEHLIKFFNDNDINYFLSSGSCLGAIRHKGFIPWDDDIDIFIKRQDYEKLLNICYNYNGSDFCFSKIDSPSYPFPFLKFYNKEYPVVDKRMLKKFENIFLYIDIFPIDYIDEKKIAKSLCKQKILKNLFFCKTIKSHKKNKILVLGGRVLSMPFSINYLKKKLNKLGASDKTSIMMDICWGTKPFSSEYFDDYLEVPFETLIVRVPKNFDGYLKAIYGDYMKLPAECDRKSHDLSKLD